MQLIVITHTDCFPGEAEILNELFAEGLAICHVRKQLEEEVRLLLQGIEPAYHDRIALHQHHQYGIKRLHFTEHNRKTSHLPPGYTLSTSIHSLSTQLPSVFSYAFFSPVFNSISKQNYHAAVGDDFYWPSETKTVPMIALGGIDASNIEKAKAMNFDGAAVMGALWKEPANATNLFKNLQRLCAHM